MSGLKPPPDMNDSGWGALSRMYFAPIKQGFFGWPVDAITLRYLEDIGLVRLFYDWGGLRVKAEMTSEGRRVFDAELRRRQTNLSEAFASCRRTFRPTAPEGPMPYPAPPSSND